MSRCRKAHFGGVKNVVSGYKLVIDVSRCVDSKACYARQQKSFYCLPRNSSLRTLPNDAVLVVSIAINILRMHIYIYFLDALLVIFGF